MIRRAAVLLVAGSATLAGAACAQLPPPDFTKPTGIWVLAKRALELDADVLGALEPTCTATQGVNPTGQPVLALTCSEYAAKLYPSFVRPDQLDAFRDSLRTDLAMTTKLNLLHGGFSPEHPVARHLDATTQVINVYFANGLDPNGQARRLVRALARKAEGMIFAWNSVYAMDGTRLIWIESTPGSF